MKKRVSWGLRKKVSFRALHARPHARPSLKINHKHVEGCGAVRKRICHGTLCSLKCQRQFQNFPIFLQQRFTPCWEENRMRSFVFWLFFCWLALDWWHWIQWKTKGEILKIVLVVLITMNHLLKRFKSKERLTQHFKWIMTSISVCSSHNAIVWLVIKRLWSVVVWTTSTITLWYFRVFEA